jgi:hypothetical protein
MRIKFHPATIIEIYPDERVEIFFGEPRYFLDKFKIRLIESTLRNSKERLVGDFRPEYTGFTQRTTTGSNKRPSSL